MTSPNHPLTRVIVCCLVQRLEIHRLAWDAVDLAF